MKTCKQCKEQIVKLYPISATRWNEKIFCTKGCYGEYLKTQPLTERIEVLKNYTKKFGSARKGTIHTKETRKKISLGTIGKNVGEDSAVWKGDKVGYFALHAWIQRIKGKARYCSNFLNCNNKSTSYEWANISGQYKRDIKDFVSLCQSCHQLFDLGKIAIRI